MKKTNFLALISALVIAAVISCGSGASNTEKPSVIRLDFATYNPPSLILKEKGWAEEVFGAEGIN